MISDSLNELPYQPMFNQQPIQVVHLNGFHNESSLFPHRHSFYMLYWTLEGEGLHYINFQEYAMCPGRIFFLHENKVHQVRSYPPGGWLILFDKMLFRQFLHIHPEQEQTGLFDYFNRTPYIDNNPDEMERFNRVATLLQEEALGANQLDISLHYLCLLLLSTGKKYDDNQHKNAYSPDATTLRKLKTLIGERFKNQRETGYYSTKLGISARKLNKIVKRSMGKLVPDLIVERLLAETEALLAASDVPIKEIAFYLGFNDQSHLSTFFRKHTGLAPSAFRERFRNARS